MEIFDVFPPKRDKIQNKFTKAMMMSGEEKVTCAMVTTRARKRKVGERDSLWDLVVNNDDIKFDAYRSEIESNGCEILVRSEQ